MIGEQDLLGGESGDRGFACDEGVNINDWDTTPLANNARSSGRTPCSLIGTRYSLFESNKGGQLLLATTSKREPPGYGGRDRVFPVPLPPPRSAT